jgi:hypothetical protein
MTKDIIYQRTKHASRSSALVNVEPRQSAKSVTIMEITSAQSANQAVMTTEMAIALRTSAIV